MKQDRLDWETAQRRNIRKMSDWQLAKEVAFAQGFGPPETELERHWLAELLAEAERRKA